MSKQTQGLRYSAGKLRLELVPTEPIDWIAQVFTNGAHKYSIYEDEQGNKILGKDVAIKEVIERKLKMVYDGANNWKNGLSWTQTMGAVKRHISEWEKGKDIDPDPTMLTKNLANAAWGLIALLWYSKHRPEFDDRRHDYLNRHKISLDIDEVLCDWVGAWTKKFGYPIPQHWNFSYENGKHFNDLKESGELEEFYLNLPRKIEPSELTFEPHCYITSRSVPNELTKKWLQINGFPTAPVYSVGFEKSKVDVAKEAGVEIFVDDRFENFVELNRAGICTFLLDAPHNRKYDVGYKRIKSLSELV